MFRYINAGPSRGGNGQSKAVSSIPVLILSESKMCYFGKAWARRSTSVVQYSVAHLSIHLEKQRPLDVTFTPSYLSFLSHFPVKLLERMVYTGLPARGPPAARCPTAALGLLWRVTDDLLLPNPMESSSFSSYLIGQQHFLQETVSSFGV